MTKSQITYLHLVRGIAAQLVLIGHVTSVSGHELAVVIQDLGVVLFFLLSGFLITTTALKKDSFVEYFIDRFARIFTAYIPCLIFILAVGIALKLGGPTDAATFFANVFMLQDFPLAAAGLKPIERLGTGAQLWTVSLEWWLYMGFGALFFLRKIPAWSLPFVIAGVYVTASQAVGGTLSLIWGAGALAAVCLPRFPKTWWYALAVFFVLLCVRRYTATAAQTFGLSQFYDLRLSLLMACALFSGFKAVEDLPIPALMHRFSAGLASYSFTLYLIHYTIMVSFQGLEEWARITTVFVISNIVAVVMYFVFERHHRAIGDLLKLKFLGSQPLKISK